MEQILAYDARGNLTRKIDGNGKEVVYGYDVKNNLTSLQYDDKIISYEYDKLNNRTKMSDESGVYVYTYDNGSRLTKVTKNGKQLPVSMMNYTFESTVPFSNKIQARSVDFDMLEAAQRGKVLYVNNNRWSVIEWNSPEGLEILKLHWSDKK